MLHSYSLSRHSNECAKILSYLGMHPDSTTTAIGSWCGMSDQKIRALCKLMAKYGIITIGKKKTFYGEATIYRRNF